MRLDLVATLAALALLGSGAAPAAPRTAPSTTTGDAPPEQFVATLGYQYAPPVVVVERGGGLTYVNADVAVHDVTSVEDGADGRPLFASATIPQGQSSPVEGVPALEVGTYAFTCTLHAEMSGTLQVVPRATPDLPLPDPGTVPAPAVGAVATPTSIVVVGDNLLATSWARGTVELFPILAGGVLGRPESFVTGLTNPIGLVVDDDGTLYVSDSHETDGGGVAGRVWAIRPSGGDVSVAGRVVVDGLPNGRHNTNGLALHAGRLWIANGNSTDDGASGGEPERPLGGTLLSIATWARGLVPENAAWEVPEDGELPIFLVEATGMRNDYDLAFRPGTDEAWLTVNGLDEQDPYGEDTLVAVRDVWASRPTHFGFPECVYAGDWSVAQNPAVATPCGEHTPPEQLLGLHTAATGLAFGSSGDLYVARFGNNPGEVVAGRDIVRVRIDAAGRAAAPEVVAVTPGPIDLAFGPDGLYVADFALGQVLLLRGVR